MLYPASWAPFCAVLLRQCLDIRPALASKRTKTFIKLNGAVLPTMSSGLYMIDGITGRNKDVMLLCTFIQSGGKRLDSNPCSRYQTMRITTELRPITGFAPPNLSSYIVAKMIIAAENQRSGHAMAWQSRAA